ncbi:hypothetical protein [Streptomyces sp. UH6]|uniref:hypothetical protein n=1 Tax=Streptomyces sp. UH6 TaxID=2748379 RepID=UPI0015D47695|nr:hypothetical protein [Streptomyces sp. UH6]NYV73867.1 hypothetical protein [Streptomyces sp. UH6]
MDNALQVPLWLLVLVAAWLGIRLWRIPLWLVTVLVLGGFLLADSILAPAVNALIK